MKHLGDITKINGAEAPPVNVIIGGSPCQDLSIAGKRVGLQGEQSGLFLEQIRIIKEMRRKSEQSGAVDVKPRYMVWENVPGVFSSNKGHDFKAVLEQTIKVVKEECPDIPIPEGGWHYSGCIVGECWSIAWRVFDAEFWGVPQKRRRIALVADFGGQCAPEVLFERAGVPRCSPPYSTTWERFTAFLAGHFNRSDKTKPGIDNLKEKNQLSFSVRERCGCEGGGKGCLVQEEKSGSLTGNNDQYVITLDYASFNQGKNAKYAPRITEDGINSTLTAKGASAICSTEHNKTTAEKQSIVRRLTPLECERLQGFPDGWTILEPIESMTAQEFVFWKDTLFQKGLREGKIRENVEGIYEIWRFEKNKDGGSWENTHKPYKHKTIDKMIKWYNKTFTQKTDGARYKALGNSIALPSWVWVLERLSYCCGGDRTIASLFDGIGGFPLIWETLNGQGTCLWASEIELFPLAVTKYHFGEVTAAKHNS